MSSPAPAIAAYVPTYAQYTPYITSEEFLTAGTGVDVSQLVANSSATTEEAALADFIGRASAQVDRICQKVLAATADVVSDEYRIMPDGRIWVPVEYTPLVAVTAVQWGPAPNALNALTDLSGIVMKRKVAKIPLGNPGLQLPNQVPTIPLSARGSVYAVVNYVNGWAHTTLASPSIVGAQSITPANVVGFVPNLPFTIKDGENTEQAVVASSYVYGSPVVPLAAPLQYAHAAGTTASALPPVIKDATISLVKWLVKRKGSKAIVMGSVNGQKVSTPKTQVIEPGGMDDYKAAVATLKPFKRAR